MIAESLQPLAVPIDRLEYLDPNPRRGDVAAVVRSLERFGQRKPITANRAGVVSAGNHTLAAARELGWSEIAVVWTDDDDVTAKAWALADNRTSDLGSYDDQVLADFIAEVRAYDETLMVAASYTSDDLDTLLASLALVGDEPEGPPSEIPAYAPEIAKVGDVWLLGPHRVMVGDCRDPEQVAILLGDTKINVAFTSPPYAEQRTYDTESGFVPIKPDEYVEWFAAVAANVAAHLADDGSWFVNIKPPADGLDTDLYVFDLVIAHVRQWGWHFATEFCWERGGIPKQVARRFKNQFEPIYQFARGQWKIRPDAVSHPSDNVPVNVGPGGGATTWSEKQGTGTMQIGKPGLTQRRAGSLYGHPENWQGKRAPVTNVEKRQGGVRGGGGGEDHQGKHLTNLKPHKGGISSNAAAEQGHSYAPGEYIGEGMAYPGNRLPTFGGTHEATGHTAAFPVGLPQWFVRAYTDEGDAVYDPFVGSGSSILAAHNTGRVGFGMELSPRYVDIVCKRWQVATGVCPVLARSGRKRSFMGRSGG